MIECFKYGVIVRGILHDLSKFLPSEFFPYANYFYGKNTPKTDKDFDFAWLLHQKKNKHHWQFWVLPEDNGGIKILDMPNNYILEMLCDWTGAGKALNSKISVKDWYLENKHKMQLSETTRLKVELLLKIKGGEK
jgi:hypothetical protein